MIKLTIKFSEDCMDALQSKAFNCLPYGGMVMPHFVNYKLINDNALFFNESSLAWESLNSLLTIKIDRRLHFSGMFSGQDMLHVTKKLRNNVRLWEDSHLFKMNTSRSAVCYVDRQDPSFVLDIARYFEMFAHFPATRAFFQMIWFLCRAFLDKSLIVKQRLYYTWRVKSFFVLWRKKVRALNSITKQTFDDVVSCCDGIMHYIWQINGKGLVAVPWFLGSNPNEQFWADMRLVSFLFLS